MNLRLNFPLETHRHYVVPSSARARVPAVTEVAGLLRAGPACAAVARTYLTAAPWIAREARHAALKLKVPAIVKRSKTR